MLSQVIKDLRYAVRLLKKNPGFAVTVALSLAIGIGANTTVFCWIQNILLSPIPGAMRQEQLAALVSNQGGGNISLLDARDFNGLRQIFAGVAATQVSPASLTADNQTDWTFGQVATANFFDLLGVKPILGRTFLPDEDRKPGGNPVMVIGESLWRRRFGSDPKVIGKGVELNRRPFTIIGVVPQEFYGSMTGVACSFWAPISMYNEVGSRMDDLTNRQARPFHNVVRLKPGVTLAQAQQAVASFDSYLSNEYPNSNREARHRVVTYSNLPYGAGAILGPALRLLMAVSFGVLLIVAANVANLQLARASSRQKEIAIRLAAGASRLQLIRQLLTESLLLSALGGAGGLLFADWGVGLLSQFVPSTSLPVVLFGFAADKDTLSFSLLLTLFTGLLFGLVPALQASRPQVYATLKEGGKSSSGSSAHHGLRQALVVVEVGLSLVLLVGAGLCVKGLRQAQKIDMGFNPDHVLTAGMQIGMNGYNESNGKEFYRKLQLRLATLPGVEEASLASWLPLGLEGCKGHGVKVDGYLPKPGENPTYEYAVVAPRYFAVMQIPLLAGRDFNSLDDAKSRKVAIINEAFAHQFWPGRNPLGLKFRAAGADRVVVGVAKTGKYNHLNEELWSFFYLPYPQYVPDLDLNAVIRTKADPAPYVSAVREAVRDIDPGVALLSVQRLTEHVSAAFFVQRMASNLLSVLGLVALLLAAMGVYAVMAYAVSQRTQEFGIRMALGAQSKNIIWDVTRRGAWMMGLGWMTGLISSLFLTRLMTGFLYGISPFDATTFIGMSLLLGMVALLACFLPAHRATRVDPIVVLRSE
jgi:predicted permease